MKLFFTDTLEELKAILQELTPSEWDESQDNKKVFRFKGGVLSWYVSTGTLQVQGREPGKTELETFLNRKFSIEPQVDNTLYKNIEFETTTLPAPEPISEIFNSDNTVNNFLNDKFDQSELVIGIVSAVGTESSRVITPLKDRLNRFGYTTEEIKVSSLLRSLQSNDEYERIKGLMTAGDILREETKCNAILAYGSAGLIKSRRGDNPKRAYIINSLKHPDEVDTLRKIYGQGFYLFGIHADKKRRLHYLTNDKGLTVTQANELTDIDEDEKIKHGQRTRDTYHLSDFFINLGKNDDQVKNTIQRFLDLIFAHPYKNPTFDEFAMFMAFSSSVRSGDLSRQVGAVLAKNEQILSTGANDCPSFGGGLYWAKVDPESGNVTDQDDGKDYTRSEDSNKAEQREIIRSILGKIQDIENLSPEQMEKIKTVLNTSRIKDLTEFGRVVHAEMEAILSCGRAGISCSDTSLYCTTFPCHNCAKHIVAAGISRVVYVEPYPKSKALDFHSDSIVLKTKPDEKLKTEQVTFEPFTGVAARRFLDFFSMSFGNGTKLERKTSDGHIIDWQKNSAHIRVPLIPKSYIDIEKEAAKIFDSIKK